MPSKKKPAYTVQPQEPLDFDRMMAELAPPPAPPEAPKDGMMRRYVGDTAASVARGAVQGVRMLADTAGADNPVSGGLRTVEDFIGGLQSASAKADQLEQARILKEAEGKGVLDQVLAGAKAFGVAPLQTMAQAAGTSIPTLATALIPGVGPAAMAARTAAGLGMGAAQGVGGVKSSIYDEVQQAALKAGASPDEAQRRATWAQSYAGPNAAQIALGAGLGAWAGRSGIEGALDRLVHGAGSKAAPGMAARVGLGAVAEGIPEAAQGGQEKFASNTALNNAGFPTDPWSGVAANATMEGLAGHAMGGVMGIPNPSAPAVVDPAKQAADAIRAGKQPESGPMTRAANAGTEAQAQAVESGLGPLPTLTEEGEQAALSAIETQGGKDAKGLKQFAAQANRAAGPRPGAPMQPGQAADPMAQPSATVTDMPFGDRVLTLQEQLADQNTRQALRDEFGDEALNQATYYASIADRPDVQLPERTRDNMLALAERMVQMALLKRVDRPGLEGGTGAAPQQITGPDGAPQQIGLDTTPTGTIRVDGDGNAAPETEADAINTRQAAATGTADERQGRRASAVYGEPGPAPAPQQPRLPFDTGPSGRMIAGPEGVAPETNADAINRRQEQAGRDAEAQRRADLGLTPDVQAVQDRNALGRAMPGDILNPKGEPFKHERAAITAQKKAKGGQVLQVAGGWVVRPEANTTEATNAQAPVVPPAAAPAAEPQAAGGAGPAEAAPAAAGATGASSGTAAAVEAAGLKAKRSSQFSAYKNAIEQADTVGGGTLDQIRADERLEDGEADQLLALAQPKTRAGKAAAPAPAPEKAPERRKRLKAERAAPAAAPEPTVDTRTNPDATTDRERTLRAKAHDKEAPGDVMLGNDKFVSLEDAKAAAQQAIDDGELNPAMPFQFNRVLDIAPRDWYRMVKEMTGEAYRDPTRGGRPQEPSAPEAPPAKPAPAASANKVFTEDMAAAARARLKAKLGRLNSGLDPETMMDGITLAGYHVEKGARRFAAFARAMVDDLGDAVKPYLVGWYMAVRSDPRAVDMRADMDKASAVEDLDVDEVLAAEPGDTGSTAAPAPEAAADEATHKDPGEPAETVTPAVVREAIKTAADNRDRPIKDVKADALRLIDEAMASAKGDDDSDVRVYAERSRVRVDQKALDRRGLIGKQREMAQADIQRRIDVEKNKAADSIGYITINVLGDGEFRVLNTKTRLAEFRREVERSPGFKAQRPGPLTGPRDGGENGSGSKIAAFDNMVNEGDLEAASDYADAVGLTLDPAKIANATKVLKWRETRPAADQATTVDGPPDWHTTLPIEGAGITSQDRTAPSNPASVIDGRRVVARLAGEAYDAITQTQRMAGVKMVPWVLPATGDRHGVVRLLPEDQKPGAPWQQQGNEPLNLGMLTRDQAVGRLIERLRSAPILASDDAAPAPAPEAAAQPEAEAPAPAAPAAPAEAPADADEEAPQLSEAQARKQFEWRDMGQKDGTKTHRLFFYLKPEDKGTGRAMGRGYVELYEGSSGWRVDGEGESFKALADAKKAAVEAAIPVLREQGWIEPAAAPAEQAAAILNAAAEPPKGKERLDVLKDVKAGAITPEEVAAAYPPAEAQETTDAQRLQAADHAKDLGGRVVWQRGDLALIEGYSLLSGDSVYIAANGSQRTRVDIKSYTGKGYTEAQKAELMKARADAVRAADELLARNPDGPFADGPLVFADDIPAAVQGVVRGWIGLLGLNGARIVVTTPASGAAMADGMAGKFRRIGKASLSGDNTNGTMQPLGGDDFHIAVRPGVSTLKALEVMAHELGHIVERRAFAQASAGTQQAIRDAHAAWLKENGSGRALDMAQAMRAYRSGQTAGFSEDAKATEAGAYWRSFGEWFADQVSRWATTQDRPVGVVEQFFKRLADRLRTFFTGERAKFKPDATVAQWLDSLAKDVPPAEEVAAAYPAAEPAEPAKINDAGEKIGGARKDMATSGDGAGTRRKATEDDRPAWARRFQISQIVTPGGMLGEVKDAGRWVVHDTRNLDWMKKPKQVGRETFATKEEAEAFVPLAAVGLKHRPVPTRDGKYEIWRDITDRKRVKVVDKTFDTRDEALAYMLANAAQIVETNTTFGEADMPLPPDRARGGPQRRAGNVNGEDFKGTFGFRGVEFGNWNNQDERQALMNDAWDGLMDLADVLNLPPKALGLNGDLALAFGARGHGLNSARAHYEPARTVINLTKENGAGSLAHEWFHALDHYFGRQDGKASATWETNEDGTRSLKVIGDGAEMVSSGFRGSRSGVRPELRAAYEALLKTMTKKAETYVEDTAKADKFVGVARDELAGALQRLRAHLADQLDPRYYKRNNKPASAELLAEFDAIAKRMLDGEVEALGTEWRTFLKGGDKPASSRGVSIAARWTNDALERMSAINKEVRGRSGFDASKDGVLDRLRSFMERYSQRLKMLAEAQAGADKVRAVPTEFAMHARELDQGRGTDYWTTPHEMAARAFQGYVEDKIAERGGVSRFLNYAPENAGILTPWGVKHPYPRGKERVAINEAMNTFVGEFKTREDDAGNVAVFSRGEQGAEQRSSDRAAAVESLVRQIAARWANAPEVVVVDSMADPRVPEAVRKEDGKQQSQGAAGQPEGFFFGGKVYLIAPQLGGDADVVRVLFHEALGHYGLRGTFGPALGTILDRVAVLQASKVRAKAKQYGLDFDKTSDRRAAAEEVLAELAQTSPNLGWGAKAIAAVRTWLRTHVPGFRQMALSDAEIVRSYILPARAFVQRGGPGGGGGGVSYSRAADQTQTPAFRAWFGDSKVVDADGKPLVVYHGTSEDFTAFDLGVTYFSDSAEAAGTYAAASGRRRQRLEQIDDEIARAYDAMDAAAGPSESVGTSDADIDKYLNGLDDGADPLSEEVARLEGESKAIKQAIKRGEGAAVYPAYLHMRNPLVIDLGATKRGSYTLDGIARIGAAIETARKDGRDGVIARNTTDSTQATDPHTVYITFRPEQIKSATGNRGTFDPADADVRFSRSPAGIAEAVRNFDQAAARNLFIDAVTTHGGTNLWGRTVGTQYHKAKANPTTFGRVFDAVQDYIKDTSVFANRAADNAPSLLPKLDSWVDLKKGGWRHHGAKPEDTAKAGEAIFRGTLDKVLYDDATLRSQFGLTDLQVGLYREFRAAVDESLEGMAKSEIVRLAGDDGRAVRSAVLAAATAEDAADIMVAHLTDLAERTANNDLLGAVARIGEKVKRVKQLQDEGYAPLMRFGKHTLHVQRKDGATEFFGMYESVREANQAARLMRGDPALEGMSFTQGVMSEEGHKLFSGMSLDALELFADATDNAQNPVYQEYLKLALSNRSAMKRMIERKAIKGYSTDVARVLASFVTSNARMSAGNIHLTDAKKAAEAIPKEVGDLRDDAIKLVDYATNPTEEAAAIRGLLFTSFIGGSVASALVNMTQPITMTLPYLTQWGGLAKAGKRLLAAAAIVAGGKGMDSDLAAALARAEADGIVSPQEIHHLQAEAMNTLGKNPMLKKAAFVWGAMFSLAEQFNRRVSFVAAYQTAQAEGIADPFAFAESAVIETQGLYNKGNKANLARGAVGATVMTFKQFATHYLEFLTRMAKSGPEGRKAVAIALALLLLTAGAGGLPFADDLDDLIDTLGQAMGYDTNSKRWKRRFVAETLGLGEDAAEAATRGLTALPGFPVDLSLRMGLGNLLPATGLMLRSNTDTGRQLLEIAGAAGGLAANVKDGVGKAMGGDVVGGAMNAMPVAVQNMAKAVQMWDTGEYRNKKGDKVMDTDALDGAMKFIGFQPADIARESGRISETLRTVQLAKNVEGEIAGRWARAIVDGDKDGIAAAKQELADWNEKNPEAPIAITRQQLRQRAKAMQSTRAERTIKATPKELRPMVAEVLQ